MFKESGAYPAEAKEENKKGIEHHNLLVEDCDKLKHRIAQSEGVVRIFIHPFMEEIYWNEEHPDQKYHPHLNMDNKEIHSSKLERLMSQGIAKLIDLNSDIPPLIIFEEESHIDESINILNSQVQDPKHEVYFVPTKYRDPVPNFDGIFQRKGDKEHDDAAWDSIANFFRAVGIRKIVLGGQYLVFHENKGGQATGAIDYENRHLYQEKFGSPNKNESFLVMHGCVPHTLNKLYERMGDIIEFSAMTAPHNRTDLAIYKKGNKIKPC